MSFNIGYFSYFFLNTFVIISKLVRGISTNKSRIIEGRLRCKELSEYLNKLGVIKRVWLAEDATAITVRVTYDPITDQLVGLTLPISDETGCPVSLSYEAADAETIKKHLKNKSSKSVYLVLAQPIDESVPPFVLQIFGTNSEFTSKDILRRWQYTKDELQK